MLIALGELIWNFGSSRIEGCIMQEESLAILLGILGSSALELNTSRGRELLIARAAYSIGL